MYVVAFHTAIDVTPLMFFMLPALFADFHAGCLIITLIIASLMMILMLLDAAFLFFTRHCRR